MPADTVVVRAGPPCCDLPENARAPCYPEDYVAADGVVGTYCARCGHMPSCHRSRQAAWKKERPEWLVMLALVPAAIGFVLILLGTAIKALGALVSYPYVSDTCTLREHVLHIVGDDWA